MIQIRTNSNRIESNFTLIRTNIFIASVRFARANRTIGVILFDSSS